jgi:hypothetical protein
MGIVIYSQELLLGEMLHRNIKDLAPSEKINICRTFNALSARLRSPTYDLSVAVLAMSNRQELLKILFLREWLQDLRVILILPNRDPVTISMGHSLRPRFISYLDSNRMNKEISDILGKMLHCGYCQKIDMMRNEHELFKTHTISKE